ncbi:hypothetical protein GCM10018966_044530 [Streptomyces yanii]
MVVCETTVSPRYPVQPFAYVGGLSNRLGDGGGGACGRDGSGGGRGRAGEQAGGGDEPGAEQGGKQ